MKSLVSVMRNLGVSAALRAFQRCAGPLAVAWRVVIRAAWRIAVVLAFLLPLAGAIGLRALSDPFWRNVAIEEVMTVPGSLLAVYLACRYGGRFDPWILKPLPIGALIAVLLLVPLIFLFPDTRLAAAALGTVYGLAAGLALWDRVGSGFWSRAGTAVGAVLGIVGIGLALPSISETARPVWRTPILTYSAGSDTSPAQPSL